MRKEINYQMNLADWSVSDNGSVKQVMTRELNLSRKEISRLKFGGEILLNGKPVRVNDHMRVGDTLTLRFPELATGEIPIVSQRPDILYEDEDVVIVNKQAGIPCHPVHGHILDSAGTVLASYYSQKGEDFIIRPIGRLDKDVSGAVIFAKNQLAASRLSKDRENGKLKKSYRAFAAGIFEIKQGMIDAPIAKAEGERRRVVNDPNGKPAVTIYRVQNEFHVDDRIISELAVEIETGRTHQIRAHMSAVGHPLIGDVLYGGDTALLDRPALHCDEITFRSPFTREEHIVRAPLPEDLQQLLDIQMEDAQEAGGYGTRKPDETLQEDSQAHTEKNTEPEKTGQRVYRTYVSPGKGNRSAGRREPEEPAVTDEEPQSLLKRILGIVLALILVGALVCLVWLGVRQFFGKKDAGNAEQTYENLTITFKPESMVEYGGDFHPQDYVLEAGGSVTADGTVDTMTLGDQKIVYTVSKETGDGTTVNREYEKVFTVKDMLGPIIMVKEDIVSIPQGTEYSVHDNIVSVTDPVDGAVEYEVEDGGFDAAVSGEYSVRVLAADLSGNEAERMFQIVVEAPAAVSVPSPSPSPSPSASPAVTPSPSPSPSAAPLDQKAPQITVSTDAVSIEAGSEFAPGSLVTSVKDETDGELPYADEEKNGSFTVRSDVNTDTPGTYTVTIIARDNAGNRSEASIAVTVKEKEADPVPSIAPTAEPSPSASAEPSVAPSGTPSPAPAVTPAPSGIPDSSDPKGQIYSFLTGSMGFNHAQACGILANIHRESRFQPKADNGIGYYGLCQWGGERLENLRKWCAENGYDSDTIDGQLHFLQYEMPLSYPNTTAQVRACPDDEEGARKACWIFAMGYEVAGEEIADMSKDKAAEYFNELN